MTTKKRKNILIKSNAEENNGGPYFVLKIKLCLPRI